jgi:glycerol-3-phosphate dehydrogenase (NAD(P)+)
MSIRRVIEFFESFEGFRNYCESRNECGCRQIDPDSLHDRALILAEQFDARADRSELREAIDALWVRCDPDLYPRANLVLSYLAETLFRDVSAPIPQSVQEAIRSYPGPKFFFVSHDSYFDYLHADRLMAKLGLPAGVTHVTGAITKGWISKFLTGLRTLNIPKNPNNVQHRAYSWVAAALADQGETQLLFARTSRYTVRAREGILREPYVPHAALSTVNTYGSVLIIPVAISYSVIPEDRYLASSALLPVMSMHPKGWRLALPLRFGFGRTERTIRNIKGIFSDVSVDLGTPFELENGDALNLQRISHRAVEEIARNKMIHPSHLVAREMQREESLGFSDLKVRVDTGVEKTRAFFASRYRKEPPFHPLITSDIQEAVKHGLKDLTNRGAVSKKLFRKKFGASDHDLINFYSYHGDRRIYPLSGSNTMSVINAGVWGYSLALHIGMNLLSKESLEETSLVLYDSREELIEKLTVEGRHPWYFKDIMLPRSVRPEADLRAAVGDTSLIMIVTPSKYFHANLIKILELAKEGSDLVIATKGFIPETGLLPCQTTYLEMERLGKRLRLSYLSGANLAHEVIERGAGVTQIACEDIGTFIRLKKLIETPYFRVVYSSDLTGSTISAAMKNVYAIGFGILEGSKRSPENFLAAYSTLVTSEIRNFGMLLGASPNTFDSESQAWMADLLATCRGGRSARFGRDLASMEDKHPSGNNARSLMEQYRKKKIAVEGFEAARFAKRIASQRGFHPPILGEIYSILHSGKKLDPDEFMEKCLSALDEASVNPNAAAIKHRRPG